MQDALAYLPHLVLLVLLIPAAILDVLYHRIPNLLTYPAILLGLALAFILSGPAGFGNHLLGMLIAGLPLLVMYLGGSLGGGDVKLMAAVGAIAGFPQALNALIASILVGGLCAALILIWQGRLFGLIRYSWQSLWYRAGLLTEPPLALPQYRDAFPMGIAIALGTALALLPGLGQG